MAKNSFYVMNRRGSFKPQMHTDNQCAKPGHEEYHYHIRLMFDGDQPLDHQQFIIDHQDVDDFIKKLGLVGSCEEMHTLLKLELPEFMKERSLSFVAYKATIQPFKPAGTAWLDFVWAREPKDLKCLSYL